MKAIPIYYTFQNDTDTTFNLLMMKHSFSNIDEVVINPIKNKDKSKFSTPTTPNLYG